MVLFQNGSRWISMFPGGGWNNFVAETNAVRRVLVFMGCLIPQIVNSSIGVQIVSHAQGSAGAGIGDERPQPYAVNAVSEAATGCGGGV
jgi:hypothetical protein